MPASRSPDPPEAPGSTACPRCHSTNTIATLATFEDSQNTSRESGSPPHAIQLTRANHLGLPGDERDRPAWSMYRDERAYTRDRPANVIDLQGARHQSCVSQDAVSPSTVGELALDRLDELGYGDRGYEGDLDTATKIVSDVLERHTPVQSANGSWPKRADGWIVGV